MKEQTAGVVSELVNSLSEMDNVPDPNTMMPTLTAITNTIGSLLQARTEGTEQDLQYYDEAGSELDDLPENCKGISPIDLESGSVKFRYDTGAPVGDCEYIFFK